MESYLLNLTVYNCDVALGQSLSGIRFLMSYDLMLCEKILQSLDY